MYFCRNNVEPTELWSLVRGSRAFVSVYQMVRRGIHHPTPLVTCKYTAILYKFFNRFGETVG